MTSQPPDFETKPEAREVTAQQMMTELDVIAREMNQLSAGLAYVGRELDVAPNDGLSISDQYRTFIDEYEVGLYQRSVDDDDFKLPSEAMRLKLAHRAMDPVLYGRYHALVKSRERMVKRVSALKVLVEANRSLLSAMKEGLVSGPGPADAQRQSYGGRRAA